MENIRERQAEAYLESAKLSLSIAQTILEKALAENKNLWAHVVKNAYDAAEQGISAALAKQGELIPKEHFEKVRKFLMLFSPPRNIETTLYFWLRKRAKSQYVDIEEGRLSVPQEIFKQPDAMQAIADCKKILDYIRGKFENDRN